MSRWEEKTEPFTSAEISRERLAAACKGAEAFLEAYRAQEAAAHEALHAAYRAKSWWYRNWHEPPGGVFGSTSHAWNASYAAGDLARVYELQRIASTTDLERIRLKDSDILMLRRWMAPEERDLVFRRELTG